MPPTFFPLRWESTGNQWWYASPIDWAAANGLYDVVRELLHIDSNLLIKLTSLRRNHRLETVWDDEAEFADVAECRSRVAKMLFLEAELDNGQNTLIGAGYGGWLLYTAASAGDLEFVTDLLQRNALLVFGEGEYGVTDILYAAARGKNSEVFMLLLRYAISPTCYFSSGSETEKPLPERETLSTFRREVMNRAVHALARGGYLKILKKLLADERDILVYRDAHGSTILHSAAGRGQVEVVKNLVESFDIIFSTDNLGNTALHVAAYRGCLSVVELLSQASTSLKASTNNVGDTFLHMAVAGFSDPGFRRLDKQIELVKELISGKLIDMEEIINVRNKKGRTALHMAVSDNFNSDLVELLISVGRINLNIRDADGMTPLDLLKQRPRTASSEVLIKQMISAGGIANQLYHAARRALISQLKLHGGGSCPGRSFGISDGEILLYTSIDGIGDEVDDCEASGFEITEIDSPNLAEKKKRARRLKFLLERARKNGQRLGSTEHKDDDLEMAQPSGGASSLRQRYSSSLSLANTKTVFSFRHTPSPNPSPSAKEKFTAGLTRGVIQPMPREAILAPSTSSPNDAKIGRDKGSSTKAKGQGSVNSKFMNKYLSLGAQGGAVDESLRCNRLDPNDQQFSSLVA